MAMMTGIPELALQEQEAISLAKAIKTFSEEFDFAPNPKIMAALGLIGTAGMIYVPRLKPISQRLAAKRQQKPKAFEPNKVEETTKDADSDKTTCH
jgi:hypothetical protein